MYVNWSYSSLFSLCVLFYFVIPSLSPRYELLDTVSKYSNSVSFAVLDKDMHNTQTIKTAYLVHRKQYSKLETYVCYVHTSVICNSNITLVFGLHQIVSMTALCVQNSYCCMTTFRLHTILNTEINLWKLSSVFLLVSLVCLVRNCNRPFDN